ncbi:hypothetical protein MPTA7396_6260 [Mycoplasmoides pneumoniae]|uniref:hypothetical protein n=1 Tax=Mycoplasmoides pneumoniae TaxID=2104 RepID=UPI000315615B|nr:hypothetical protein [Mycoplasmoides pneumoniae]GLL57458.1 hypothetical protein KPI25BX_2200 [Mycoplasmoides pneumoniae]GLL58893.1 hypothetical protein Y12242BV_2170 [Mycoplasmoides pneumoniae]GLL59658.1 hypothetical protein Y12382J_2640 [Mycoplasmoides pneumoniae]
MWLVEPLSPFWTLVQLWTHESSGGVASINTIPSSLDVHRANYDLNFSLTYTNK